MGEYNRRAVYANSALYRPEEFDIISGHVQTAVETANVLAAGDTGDVHLLTSDAPLDHSRPPSLKREVSVCRVTNATKSWPDLGVKPIAGLRHVADLVQVLRQGGFGSIHMVGGIRTAFLLSIIGKLVPNCTRIFTLTNVSPAWSVAPKRPFVRGMLNSCDRICALTEYTAGSIRRLGVTGGKIHLTRPGFGQEAGKASSSPFDSSFVLFFRNANWRNGADICAKVYERLAPSYPEIEFVFAVRANDQYSQELAETASRRDNIRLLTYPYPGGLSKWDLLCNATVVLLPLRSLSMNPQVALMEALGVGTPVITTPRESNVELVEHGSNGLVVEPNVQDVESAVRRVVEKDPSERLLWGQAGEALDDKWSWDRYSEALGLVYDSETSRT